MRHGRIITAGAVFAALIAGPGTTSAFADSGLGDGSAAVVDDKPAVDSSTADPGTVSKPATDTSAPTEKPSTDTSAPPTDSSTSTSSTPSTPIATPSTPVAMPVETPTTPQDTPTTPDVDTPVAERPGGGGELPFTGPGDVILAVVLALLAGTGGVLFLAGAAGREQLDTLNRRSMDSPSGFRLAYRELLKQQVD